MFGQTKKKNNQYFGKVAKTRTVIYKTTPMQTQITFKMFPHT